MSNKNEVINSYRDALKLIRKTTDPAILFFRESRKSPISISIINYYEPEKKVNISEKVYKKLLDNKALSKNMLRSYNTKLYMFILDASIKGKEAFINGTGFYNPYDEPIKHYFWNNAYSYAEFGN